MYYSQTTGGFYSKEIHGSNIPSDALEITDDVYTALLEGQSRGLLIQADHTGMPELGTPAPLPVNIEANIASRRYAAETAGITVNGMRLPTDRDSQALVTGAALAAVIDPAYSCQWKTVEGFITLGAQQIIALASAMRAHVQACFDREAALLATLQDGEFVESMLEEEWPQ